jgi:hypothetical protein
MGHASWLAIGPKNLLFLLELLSGELFDLEALSTHCAATKRYTFFFSSWPLNVSVTLIFP